MLDIEQYWNNWDTWYLAIMKKISWNMVEKIKPYLISIHAKRCMDYLKSKTDIPVIGYTSKGFVIEHAQEIAGWMDDHLWCIAHYVVKSSKKINLQSWSELEQYYPHGKTPLLPPGITMKNVVGWQFSGDLISLPGLYGNAECTRPSYTDLNLFDPVWLEKVLSRPITNVPVVAPTKPVVAYDVAGWVTRGLRLREGAGIDCEVITVLPTFAHVVYCDERIGSWVKVKYNDLTGWAHSAYLVKVS